MANLTKNENLFLRWLRLFDTNLLTIIIGVLTGLAINTLTGFGYQWMSIFASSLFLGAIGFIIGMLQVQKHVREDEAGFLELGVAPQSTQTEANNELFQNQTTLAFERAISTDTGRRKWFFTYSGSALTCFLIGMVILYYTSTTSQNSNSDAGAKLTNADSVINAQAVQLGRLERIVAKDDSLLVRLTKARSTTVQPATIIPHASVKDRHGRN